MKSRFLALLGMTTLLLLAALPAMAQYERAGGLPMDCAGGLLYVKYDTATLTWKCDAGPAGTAHNLLSGTHLDTAVGVPLLGDILFADTVPLWTRLAGNTTTTRKFLRQVGNGAVSAAPAWDTLLAGDLPAGYIDATTDFLSTLCGTNQILEDQGASWACINTPAGGSDAKVAVFEAGVQVGTVGRRLDFITAADFVVTEDSANDQFDISIAAGAISDSLVAASGITTRSKLPAAIVYDDEVTTYGAFKQDFGAATVEIPNGITPPATCTVGEIFHDTDAAVGARYLLCTAVNTFTATDNPFGMAIDDAELASNYSGIGGCTNQFPRTLSDNAAPACADVAPADFASQTANTVLAAPDGAAGDPTFRALVDADVPNGITLDNLTQVTTRAIGDTTGTLAAGRGGTGQTAATEDGALVANGTAFVVAVLPACAGATTDKLLYDAATNAFSCGVDQGGGAGAGLTRIAGSSGAAGADLTWQRLTANSTDCTTTALCAAAITTTGVGAGTWKFKYTLIMQSAATGTGISFGVNHTGTITKLRVMTMAPTTATTTATGTLDSDSTTTAGQMFEAKHDNAANAIIGVVWAGVDAANTDILAYVEGIIIISATGSLELKIGSETGGTAVRLMADSILELHKIG